MAVKFRRRTSALGRMPTVAKMAICRPFGQSELPILPSSNLKSLRWAIFRFSGESDGLCNDRTVIARLLSVCEIMPRVSSIHGS
jgi:hypothetical protein